MNICAKEILSKNISAEIWPDRMILGWTPRLPFMSQQRLLSLKKALNGILRWTSSEYFKMKLQVEMYSFQFAVHLSLNIIWVAT